MNDQELTPKEIGKIFRERREELGLSPEEAYSESRIHSNVIKDIENGVFDRLGKPYLKSFIKKYAEFLKLDTADILAKYETAADKIPAREFDLNEQYGQKSDTVPGVSLPSLTEKQVQALLVGTISLVMVLIVLVAGTRIRSAGRNRNVAPVRTFAEKKAAPEPVVIAENHPVASVPVHETAVPEEDRSPSAAGEFTLTLKARGEVWIQVTRDERILYAGTLQEGGSKTWKTDGTLTVWTGKADMLDFVLDTRRLGTVAAGVVRNIQVSKKGIMVNGAWVEQGR